MSETKSDEQEFMEVAAPSPGNASEVEPRKTKRASPPAEPADEEEVEKKYGKGQPTQYARMGPGFSPVGSTVLKLKSGVYKVVCVPGAYIFSPRNVITDNLLRLPDSKSDMVISEIEKFWTLKTTYEKYGFLHKRGFLLWGPPGSGKTSTTAIVLKQMVERGGIVILMESIQPNALASALAEFRSVEPDRPCILVMEDLDTIIDTYGEADVLSLLDGEQSIDNVVVLATTNYPEQLDGRVVNRPSRFDRIVKIGMPNADARRLYLESRELDKDEVEEWVELTDGFSIAHMKELIVGVKCLGQPVEEVALRLRQMFNKVTGTGGAVGFGSGNRNDD